MVRKCCVPGCKVNYKSQIERTKVRLSVFSFPKDNNLRKQWLDRILRKEEFNTKNVGVCILHFEDDAVKKDGQFNFLKKGAIPSIFYGENEFYMTDENEKYNIDIINDYNDLINNVCERVILNDWEIKVDSSVYIYKTKIRDNGYGVFVEFNIIIGFDLSVKIIRENDLVDSSFYGDFIPSNSNISYFSQIEMLIAKCEEWITISNVQPHFGYENKFDWHHIQNVDLPFVEVKQEEPSSYPEIEGYFSGEQVIQQTENCTANQKDTLNENSNICSVCGKEFDQYIKLMIHMKRHDPNQYCQVCPICDKSLPGNYIKKHMETHNKAQNHDSIVGGTTTYKHRALENMTSEPQLTPNSTPLFIGNFYCDICSNGVNYKTRYEMKLHMRKHCKLETTSNIISLSKTCPTCGKEFSKRSQLSQHMRRHNRKLWKTCPICNKSFPDGLPRHMNSHFKTKNYVCDICGSAYSQKSSLKIHTETNHLKGAEYFCDICNNGRNYNTIYGLKKHLNTHADPSCTSKRTKSRAGLPKIHGCGQCNSKFVSKFLLSQHNLSAHTDEKQFQCEICYKKFANKSLLKIHKKIHSNDQKYTCDECGKSFRLASYLRKHLPRHKGSENKRKICLICGKRYVNNVDLRSHLKKSHNVEENSDEHSTKNVF